MMPNMRKIKSWVLFNAISILVLFSLFQIVQKKNSEIGVSHNRRVMIESYNLSSFDNNVTNDRVTLMNPHICGDFFEHKGFVSRCDYILAHPGCASGGYLNYIKFFYCDCQNYSFFGYLVLGAWLVVLFYLLGNTAADYFCCSLEKLSNLLKMSPTVAGVTLLPLGNGAPDVFASVASFVGTDSGDVGLNSVLGGAVFVTCIVVGVVSISISEKRVQIDRECFIRDLCFFLFSIVCLALILVIGKVTVWGAIAFVSIYVVYAVFVAVDEILKKKGRSSKLNYVTPLLPVAGGLLDEGDESLTVPLLSPDNCDDSLLTKLPHWIWNSSVAIYSDYIKASMEDNPSPLRVWTNEGETSEGSSFSFSKLCSLVEIPLNIPRRLTIPIVEEDRWSKVYAVASALFAPALLAVLWNTQENLRVVSGVIAYIAGLGIGIVLSGLAYYYTSMDHPPRSFLLPWVCGGFFMSIVWFYIVANELVSLLVSFGVILGINPSMLALTVLAWGNSMGDLMSNTALAMNERNGVQIAMSGSFAGPMFNTLVGLGLSLLLGAWSMGSMPYVVPRDSSLFVTLGFLAAGLIWSLFVLPLSDMRPNKTLGIGLIAIYLLFLTVRLVTGTGSGSVDV